MSFAHAYRYARPSAVEPSQDGLGCILVGDQDGLFRGRVQHPRLTAMCLRTLSNTVMARFYVPANVLIQLLDPVVTVGRETLRFEGFSGCCSTYARLDLTEDAFSSVDERTPGTTNVDFQAPMRAALAKVRDTTPFVLEVGKQAVAIDTGEEPVLERKVKFPMRWLKGLGEVQAYLARMEKKFSVSRTEALRFLRGLPRTTRHVTHVEPMGKGLRVTQRASAKSVQATGIERLRLLEDLVPLANELHVFADATGSSTWQLDFGSERFTLVLSPERWRGFSGEGQLLSTLATADADDALGKVRACLRWQDRLDPKALAEEAGIDESLIHEALAMLASRGLVGFDLVTRTWFHRELPFDLDKVEALHPRLKSARKLVADGAVTLRVDDGQTRGTVRSADVDYEVVLQKHGDTCTCPWYAQHRGERGPCKHVLAVQIVAEGESR